MVHKNGDVPLTRGTSERPPEGNGDGPQQPHGPPEETWQPLTRRSEAPEGEPRPGFYESAMERRSAAREDADELLAGSRGEVTRRHEAHGDPEGPVEGEEPPAFRSAPWETSRQAVKRRRAWVREPFYASELMTARPRTVGPSASLLEAARAMREEDVGVLPVVDAEGRLLGLLTDRDMVVRAMAENRLPDQTAVSQVMTREVDAVTVDHNVHDVLALMGKRQVRRVPVVERGDRLLGIISMADIARRAEYDAELQHALDRISGRRSFWTRTFG